MVTPSLSDLQSQIHQLEAKRDELKAAAAAQRQTDIAAVVDDLRAKIAEYGISAKELGLQGKAPTKGTRRISAVRTSPTDAVTHRGPNGQTWTSGTRGRKPHWLAEKIAKSTGVVTD